MLDLNAAPLQPEQEELPPVWAYEISTGGGKTTLAIQIFSKEKAKHHDQERNLVYAMPTHRLGEDIVAQFAEQGLKARVWQGLERPVPGSPGRKMCDNMDRVKVAMSAGLPVAETCCKQQTNSGWVKCPFFNTCAYQDQMKAEPDVWIMPHQNLHSPNKAIGKPTHLIIDETFYSNGIVEASPISVGAIRSQLIPPQGKELLCADLEAYRSKLADALDKQQSDGGFKREHMASAWVNAEMCTQAIKLEWAMIAHYGSFGPDSSNEEIAKFKQKIPAIRFHRRMSRLWAAMRDLWNQSNEDAASGRIYITQKEGDRIVHLSGLKPIAKQWRTRTKIMDATLPGLPILQAYHPQVEVRMKWNFPMPHAYVRQAIYAPVSQKKLLGSERNRDAIRRYILRRWIETGRQPTLVICQMEYELWLKGCGLPDSITIEHLNNIAGLDRYKAVRLLITIGRTMPKPADVEAMAGALTGLEPVRCEAQENGSRWYGREIQGALLTNGDTPGITCLVHPDPVCEAIRWRICEGELVQAIGRARGVNRTADDPVDIDILADVCLPITLNEIGIWKDPSLLVEMFAAGVVLTNRADMVKCWPDVWKNEKAAQRALEDLPEAMRQTREPGGQQAGTFSLREDEGPSEGRPGHSPLESLSIRDFVPAWYQMSGERMQKRRVFVDPGVVPDPRAWLEKRLGPLAHFEIVP